MSENQFPAQHDAAPAEHKPSRLRSAGVIGVAGVAGIAMGLGATSLALWNDDVTFTGSIAGGYEYFAAGLAGEALAAASSQTAPPDGNSVTVLVGAHQAQSLAADGEVAVAFQVDSLSQGNMGLEYTLTPPVGWGDGYFAASQVSIYWVDEPEQCAVGTDPPDLPSDGHVSDNGDGSFTSIPVSADYTDSTDPTVEYWCLTATLGALPDEGEYTNTATVTGQGPAGNQVSDRDSWSTDVTTALDPGDEADHPITFTYNTFRPGEVTTP